MRISTFIRSTALAAGFLLPLLAAASSGEVDAYDCHHGGPDNDYHCHGSAEAAKRSHMLIGISLAADSWHYNNGPANIFGGFGAAAEFGRDWFSLHGDWHHQPNYNGDAGYNLKGWQAGLKLGGGIARVGAHPYAHIGYFQQTFELINNQEFSLSGVQGGAGLMQNFRAMALDVRITYRQPTSAKQIWIDLGAPGLTAHLHTQLTLSLRL